MHECVFSRFSHVQLFATPWTVTRQAPLSLGFSRQEYQSGLPCPPPGIEPLSPVAPALQTYFLPLSHWGGPNAIIIKHLSIPFKTVQLLKKYLFIWLHCVLVASCKIFCCRARTLVAALSLSCLTACGILVPQLGITPLSPALRGRFLTTGLPEKSPGQLLLIGMMQFIPWRSKELLAGALECQEA